MRDTDAKDITMKGSGIHWDGRVELSERAWETFNSGVNEVSLSVRSGTYLVVTESSREVVDQMLSDNDST